MFRDRGVERWEAAALSVDESSRRSRSFGWLEFGSTSGQSGYRGGGISIR